MKLCIRILCATLPFAAAYASAWAMPIRAITSATVENWSLTIPTDYPHTEWLVEEAVILDMSKVLSLIARARYGSPSSSIPYGGLGAGLSYVFAPGLYADLLYTALLSSRSGAYSSEAESSLNYETERYYVGLRERFRFDASAYSSYSTAFGRYIFLKQLALWSSYTLAFDSTLKLDHAYWGYIEISPATLLSFTLGGTVYSFNILNPITERTQGLGESLIAGLALRPKKGLSFKYQFEYFLGERDWNKTTHTLVADIRL